MSAAASEAMKMPEGEAPSASAAVAAELGGLTPMVESDTDRHETLLTYDPSSRLPVPVVLVWICAFLGLGAYMITLYLPDLALWQK